jgi:hypothetical protein
MRDGRTVQGEGAFQWNAGGWFGGQLGATVWLLVLAGVLLVREGWAPALAAALGGLVPNVVGTALWLRRDRLAPYPAIQTLFAVAGLSVLAAAVALARLDALPEMSPNEPAGWRHAWLLLLYPGLMLMAFFQERGARRRGAGTRPGGPAASGPR